MNLLPCPFCGTAPIRQPWHGGAPTKILISCDNEDCAVSPGVTGETPPMAEERWNTRAQLTSARSAGGRGVVETDDCQLRLDPKIEVTVAWAKVDDLRLTIRDLHAACDTKAAYGDRQKARADRLTAEVERLRAGILEYMGIIHQSPSLRTLMEAGSILRALLNAPTEGQG